MQSLIPHYTVQTAFIQAVNRRALQAIRDLEVTSQSMNLSGKFDPADALKLASWRIERLVREYIDDQTPIAMDESAKQTRKRYERQEQEFARKLAKLSDRTKEAFAALLTLSEFFGAKR